MTAFDLAPLDERYLDRQSCGDEFDADRLMRAALQIEDLRAIDPDSLADCADDDHAEPARH